MGGQHIIMESLRYCDWLWTPWGADPIPFLGKQHKVVVAIPLVPDRILPSRAWTRVQRAVGNQEAGARFTKIKPEEVIKDCQEARGAMKKYISTLGADGFPRVHNIIVFDNSVRNGRFTIFKIRPDGLNFRTSSDKNFVKPEEFPD